MRDHVDCLASTELEERSMQEELEALRASNLAMRKQINASAMRKHNTKSKAKDQYVADTVDLQTHLQE